MLVFYFAAALVIWLGILSLRNGFSFASYVRREIARPLPDYTPFASVIAPTRGLDQGLRENIAPLLKQNYPDYEVIFVTDNADDPSVPVIEEASKSSAVSSRVVFAGDAIDSGQKVHNLRVAVSQVDARSQVLVFVDTDATAARRLVEIAGCSLGRRTNRSSHWLSLVHTGQGRVRIASTFGLECVDHIGFGRPRR